MFGAFVSAVLLPHGARFFGRRKKNEERKLKAKLSLRRSAFEQIFHTLKLLLHGDDVRCIPRTHSLLLLAVNEVSRLDDNWHQWENSHCSLINRYIGRPSQLRIQIHRAIQLSTAHKEVKLINFKSHIELHSNLLPATTKTSSSTTTAIMQMKSSSIVE